MISLRAIPAGPSGARCRGGLPEIPRRLANAEVKNVELADSLLDGFLKMEA
jgi:hypothetical protein